MTKPTCRWCGSTLRPFRYRADGPNPFSQTTLRKIDTVDDRPPKYGPNGDNAFCTNECARRWAVRELRKAKE